MDIIYKPESILQGHINGEHFLNGALASTGLTKDEIISSIDTVNTVDNLIEVTFTSDIKRQEWLNRNHAILVNGTLFRPQNPDIIVVYIHRAHPSIDNDSIKDFLKTYGEPLSPMEDIYYKGEWTNIKTGSRKITMGKLNTKAGLPRFKYIKGRKIKFHHANQVTNLDDRLAIIKREREQELNTHENRLDDQSEISDDTRATSASNVTDSTTPSIEKETVKIKKSLKDYSIDITQSMKVQNFRLHSHRKNADNVPILKEILTLVDQYGIVMSSKSMDAIDDGSQLYDVLETIRYTIKEHEAGNGDFTEIMDDTDKINSNKTKDDSTIQTTK